MIWKIWGCLQRLRLKALAINVKIPQIILAQSSLREEQNGKNLEPVLRLRRQKTNKQKNPWLKQVLSIRVCFCDMKVTYKPSLTRSVWQQTRPWSWLLPCHRASRATCSVKSCFFHVSTLQQAGTQGRKKNTKHHKTLAVSTKHSELSAWPPWTKQAVVGT